MMRTVVRLLWVASVLGAVACVTTENQAGPPSDRALAAGPDPRASLPLLAKKQVMGRKPLAPQGIRVVTKLDPGDPLVNVRALFTAGSRDDPPGQEGITLLAAHLMASGTEALTGAELRAKLFPWAAELSVEVDKETTVFIGRVHKDHLDEFVRVFTDTIAHPRLDPADFERLHSESQNFLIHDLRQGDDELLQREALEVMLYDHGFAGPDDKVDDRPAPPPIAPPHNLTARHPYRHTPRGTVQGLAALTLDDVRAHIAQVFTEDRLMLGLGGGASARVLPALTSALAALPDSGRAAPLLPMARPAFGNRALIIDKNAPGSAVSLGYTIPVTRAHPDYPALKVAEAFFGEHRNRVGWLFQAMREQRGLNYGDYAYVEHFAQQGWSTNERLNVGRHQQYFSIWIRPVEHKNRHFALRQAVYELDRFVKRGIADDETYRRLITFLLGRWQQKEQEPMRQLGYAMDDAFYSTGYDRDGLLERIQRLTRAEVNAAIRKHLHADRLNIVIVTEDGHALAQELIAGAPSPIVYPAAKDADILAEDKIIERYPLDLGRHSVRVVPPEKLFER